MRVVCKTGWSPSNDEIRTCVLERKFVEKRDPRPGSSAVRRDSSRFVQLVSKLSRNEMVPPQHAPEYVKRNGSRLQHK